MRFPNLPIKFTFPPIAGENGLKSIAIEILDTSGNYVKENPYQCAAGATIMITSIVITPVLGLVGFTSIGPAAGTVATAWQSSIGAVQAGSAFAVCQSISMGGVATQTVSAVGAAGAGVAAMPAVSKTVGALMGWLGWNGNSTGIRRYTLTGLTGSRNGMVIMWE
ncbi:hypothetical protein EMCG_00583 [[Emmonsia] crescens]|uniref:Uncharacterized protein n=1 Tax=[Emmonsia] crescens TaxID=73230 RepID=A0A0G2IZN0_9EURO|nr:hypothetical protein EMCG_00583 [Emmonsia crescens UAMH 3008]